jgi:hypothetical protein
MHTRLLTAALVVLATFMCVAGSAQEVGPGEGRGGQRAPKRPDASVFLTEVPEHPGSVILGRPTATSVTLSLLWHANTEVVLVWDPDPGRLPTEGHRITLSAREPKLRLSAVIRDARGLRNSSKNASVRVLNNCQPQPAKTCPSPG